LRWDPTDTFAIDQNPGRIVFGAGAIQRVPQEAERLGIVRALVVTTAGHRALGQELIESLGARAAGHFAGAVMHTPLEVTEAALKICAGLEADGIVAIGGGSTTGLSKAIALRTDLPQIVVPTTYAGSEVTPILGETVGGKKSTQRSMRVLPEVVIYDVRLTLGMPVPLSVTSGLNAIAHAAEALYARDRNPFISLLSEQALRALSAALPRIVASPTDETARSQALYGAWLCGICLGSVGMAMHHKLCHTLGGAFNLPHAETHSVILPHALAYTLPAAEPAREALASIFGGINPAHGIHEFARSLGAPTALGALGMPEEAIDKAADLAVENPYWNPRPIERQALRSLIARAWRGEAPCSE
jgi:alcohol dehydrogenase class IV